MGGHEYIVADVGARHAYRGLALVLCSTVRVDMMTLSFEVIVDFSTKNVPLPGSKSPLIPGTSVQINVKDHIPVTVMIG